MHRGDHRIVRSLVLPNKGLEARLCLPRLRFQLRELPLDRFVPFLADREAPDHPAQRDRQGSREGRDAPSARRRGRCRDGSEELLHRLVRHSHSRVSRICSRWNRASLKYWVAPSVSASSGTSPMISLSAISTPSFAASVRTASNAWTREVLR